MIIRRAFPCIILCIQAIVAWKAPAEYAVTPSGNGRFLQTASGAPFFWQADTAWLLFHRLNYTEAELYLSDRAHKGFTVVLAVGFTQIGIDSPNRNGDLPFIDKDVNQPNEAYWAYVDSIIELAWKKGIRVCMVPAWGNYVHDSANSPGVLNTNTAPAFGRFIGHRYPYLPKTLVADTNPCHGGVPPTYEVTDWSPVYDALANGIVAGERQAIAEAGRASPSTWWPLMTMHPTNQWFQGGPLALAHAFFGNRSWLTLDTSQSGHTDHPPNPPIPWWNCRRGWEPVELMYAAGSNAGGRIFSGAAGITYGANAVWQMAIPGTFASDGSGPSNDWRSDLLLPGSGQMQWIQKAVLGRGTKSFFQRVPAPEIIIGDPGTDDSRVMAMRDGNDRWIMVYSPKGMAFRIDTSRLSSCRVQAHWYNPLTGESISVKYGACGTQYLKQFTPPRDDQDWVLMLERVIQTGCIVTTADSTDNQSMIPGINSF
ncbi:hypothetical protein BDV59DRAFT_195060 [Aspergillus ambiguus]|uniref:glycoside hydrolase family 140 protein n=1 Tax=Aspergillus ambiguus TaxID=176160 RepID=UPI003CCE151E